MKKIILDVTHPSIFKELKHFEGPYASVEIPQAKHGFLASFNGKTSKDAWRKVGTMIPEERKLYTLKRRAYDNVNHIVSLAVGESCGFQKKLSKRAIKKWNNEVSDEIKEEHKFWLQRANVFGNALSASIYFRFPNTRGLKFGEDYSILAYEPERIFATMISSVSLVFDAIKR